MVKTDILEKYRLTTLKVIVTSGSTFSRQNQETLIKKLPNALIKNCYGKLLNLILKITKLSFFLESLSLFFN